MTPLRKGLFIAFEGIDGAGKSTAREWFCDELEKNGLKITRTREPGGTPLAERVRELVLWGIPQHDEDFPDWAEVCLYNASRATHLKNMILPHLDAGNTVVCDRFCDSTYAHQGGGRGLDIDKLKQIHEIVNEGIVPDLTFLFDGDPAVFRKRLEVRQPDRLEKMPIEFQYRSRQVHLDLAAAEPERYILIDAEQPIESVKAQLMAGVMHVISQVRKRITL